MRGASPELAAFAGDEWLKRDLPGRRPLQRLKPRLPTVHAKGAATLFQGGC